MERRKQLWGKITSARRMSMSFRHNKNCRSSPAQPSLRWGKRAEIPIPNGHIHAIDVNSDFTIGHLHEISSI